MSVYDLPPDTILTVTAADGDTWTTTLADWGATGDSAVADVADWLMDPAHGMSRTFGGGAAPVYTVALPGAVIARAARDIARAIDRGESGPLLQPFANGDAFDRGDAQWALDQIMDGYPLDIASEAAMERAGEDSAAWLAADVTARLPSVIGHAIGIGRDKSASADVAMWALDIARGDAMMTRYCHIVRLLARMTGSDPAAYDVTP